MSPSRWVVTAGAVAAFAVACTDRGEVPSGSAPAMRAPAASGSERERMLGAFLSAHWRVPVPPQGEAPADWPPAERSLDPAVCGSCHPQQHADWQTSLHAGAFSPGFAGQLIEGALARPRDVRQCQTCHAPLAEQQPFGPDLAPSRAHDPDLRRQGVVCPTCHVRGWSFAGPPRRPEAPAVAAPVPHAGFAPRPEFQESRFCAPCHQFFDDAGVNGKPLENTFVEWQQSPQAAEGRSCQSCHMPDRAHLWRGIHDPETVRQAVDVELLARGGGGDRVRYALVLRNRDVGHAFPTYVTPRVFLTLFQVDAGGGEIPGTRATAAIGREIDFSSSPWRERFDTRVMPGESVRLDYDRTRAAGARALLARVTVDPAYHYRGVFEGLLGSYRDPEARALIQEAQRRTSEVRYVLSEIRRAFE